VGAERIAAEVRLARYGAKAMAWGKAMHPAAPSTYGISTGSGHETRSILKMCGVWAASETRAVHWRITSGSTETSPRASCRVMQLARRIVLASPWSATRRWRRVGQWTRLRGSPISRLKMPLLQPFAKKKPHSNCCNRWMSIRIVSVGHLSNGRQPFASWAGTAARPSDVRRHQKTMWITKTRPVGRVSRWVRLGQRCAEFEVDVDCPRSRQPSLRTCSSPGCPPALPQCAVAIVAALYCLCCSSVALR